MKRINTTLLPALILLVCISSCQTYYLTPQSLSGQLKNAPPGNLHQIAVTDKNGAHQALTVTPHMEIRVTDKTGRHRIVYLDLVYIQDDSILVGGKTHAFDWQVKFNLNNITKIELQK